MNKLRIMTFAMILLLFALPAWADVPVSMQFQGYVTDQDGVPLTGSHSMHFSLYGSLEGDDVVWTATQSVDVQDGAFVAVLGGALNPLDANVFGDQALWLGVAVDDGEELAPRSPISAVPYATRAAVADNAMTQEDVQGLLDNGGYLTEVTEVDPQFSTAPASAITLDDINEWHMAYGWGDHAEQGYLTDYQEIDPVFSQAPASGVTSELMSQWSDAYTWGDHAEVGYLTEFMEMDPTVNELAQTELDCLAGEILFWNGLRWECTEDMVIENTDTLAELDCQNGEIAAWNADEEMWQCQMAEGLEMDPVFSMAPASFIGMDDMEAWSMAYSWGDHAMMGYLTSYTETDPLFSEAPASGISASQITDWDAAYSWGDHASVGYLTEYMETDPEFAESAASGIASGDIAHWDVAYSWGDHANAGYLTGYIESDPVFNLTAAAGISNTQVDHWDTAYSWGDHASAGYVSDAYTDLSSEGYLDYTDNGDLVTKSQADSNYGSASDVVTLQADLAAVESELDQAITDLDAANARIDKLESELSKVDWCGKDLDNCDPTEVCMNVPGGTFECVSPYGPLYNWEESTFTNIGFSICHQDTYNDTSSIATIQSNCAGSQIVMACRPVGDTTFTLAGLGDYAEVFTDTGSDYGDSTVNTHNGINWYFNSGLSWGFAQEGEAVLKTSCDTSNTVAESRMCWHASGGNMTGGYRCGATTSLNHSTTWERVVMVRP